jgi:Asp/Glu/hydantoin racemase
MIRIFAVHTAMALVEPVSLLFSEHLPQVKLHHIADDSLIREVIENNGVTPAVRRRLLSYYQGAADAGACLVFNTCSSVGEVAEMARLLIAVPILRIDEPMARTAAGMASRIGVLATLPSTLRPTADLIRKMAREQNKRVEIAEGLADGAFQAVMSGDRETHDRLIMEASGKVAARVDVIVLAQGSMARMEASLAATTGIPVLSSPLSGVLGVKEFLIRNRLIDERSDNQLN